MALALLLASCSDKYPFVEKPPDANAIPGTYIHADDAENSAWLDKNGYTDHSAKIVLHSDKTFEIRQMPHFWLSLMHPAGYDSCSGTWNVFESQGVYSIGLDITQFSEDSPFVKSRDYAEFKKAGRYPYGARLGIIGPTKERKEYGLAVGVNVDEGYIIFARE